MLSRIRTIKTGTMRLLVIAFVFLTLFASLLTPAGQPHYRLKERVEAMKAYTLSPSASTKAALDDEFARLHHHEATMGGILPVVVLLIDVGVIYFFWNYGTRKTTA
jgi:hypothetical protein